MSNSTLLLSFQFDSSTFIDPDGDDLTYTALNLPGWLQFYPTSQKFIETPTNYNMGNYLIVVYANDGYKNFSDTFEILVIKHAPVAISQTNQNFLGQNYDWSVSQTSFIDPDGDQLAFSACLMNNSVQSNLPNWLFFDSSRLRIYGTPSKLDIAYYSTNLLFF